MAEPAARLQVALRPWVGLAFASCLLLFARRAAPGVTFEDAGELASAAATLGVAHPPGYPLFTLLGQLWIRLLAPLVVDPARALNLFSALCAAASCALVARFVALATQARVAALASALLLALSTTFGAQAVVVEVYALACVCLALLLNASLLARKPAGWSALWFGLGAAAHLELLCALPLLLIAVWRERQAGERAARLALRVGLGLLLGLSLYLYVPLAAARDPLLNWGDPSSFARLAAHLGRDAFALDRERAWGPQLAFLLEQSLGQWPLALVVCLPCLYVAWVAFEKRLALCVAGCGAALALGLLWAVNYPVEQLEARWRLAGSYAPLPLLLALLCGLCLGALERLARVAGQPARAYLAAALMLAGAWFLGPQTLAGAEDQRTSDQAQRYAQRTLASAPPDAILVVSGLYEDVLLFPLLYEQLVHGARPDLTLVSRGLLEAEWYRQQLARRAPALAPALAELQAAFENPGVLADGGARREHVSLCLQRWCDGPRAVVCPHRPGELLSGTRELWPHELLWQVLPAAAARPPGWQAPQLSAALPAADWFRLRPGDPWCAALQAILSDRDQQRAQQLEAAGRSAEAAALRQASAAQFAGI